MTHRSPPSGRHVGHVRAGRTAVVVAAALLATLASSRVAGAAGLRARSLGNSSVTTVNWGVSASVTSMTFTTNTAQTSTITNTGTVDLSAHSYSVTISQPKGRAPTFTIHRCPVAWVGSTCPGGGATQIGGTLSANTTTILTSVTALTPGQSIYLEVQPAGVRRATTVTILPQVTSPAQLRAPVQSNQ